MEPIRGFLFMAIVALALIVPQAVAALDGKILYTEGTVTLTSGGAPQDAGPGATVSAGDVVSTGADGLAVVDLSNATQIKLRENTSVTIAALGGDTRVSLSAGALFTRILGKLAGNFSVQAGTTTAGVRGTEFFVAYGRTVDQQADVWLCVNSGTVDVSVASASQHVLVPAGKGINIVGGAKLTPPRGYHWTRSLNWNMDPSRGSVEDHTSMDQAYDDLLNHDYN
ncbi:MAG TPA: FecR family protein [Spirochaetia bacterium]|nr:FecR family protein [Spirochaetia bacterium]